MKELLTSKGLKEIEMDPYSEEDQQELQRLLDKGWHVYLSIAMAEDANDMVRVARVILKKKKRKPLEYSWYSINRKE